MKSSSQGQYLKKHKENEGEFYSEWKAAGIGAICSIVFVVITVGYTFILPEDFDATTYDEKIAEFENNEEEALQLFDMLGKSDKKSIIEFIDKTGIPNWKKNIMLLNSLDQLDGLTDKFLKQNQILREYSQLRIKSYILIKKAVLNQTSEFDEQINRIHINIDNVLKSCKQN